MIKRFEEKDYEELQTWFKFWKWEPVPLHNIPDDSFFVERNGQKIVFCSIYLSISGNLAYIEWFVMNPKAPKHLRIGCIEELLNFAFDYIKGMGYSMVFSSTKNPNLIKHYIKNGFVKSDEQITNFVKII